RRAARPSRGRSGGGSHVPLEKQQVQVVLQVHVHEYAPLVVVERVVVREAPQPVVGHPDPGVAVLLLPLLLAAAVAAVSARAQAGPVVVHARTPSIRGEPRRVNRSLMWWVISSMCGPAAAGTMARLFAGSAMTGTIRSSRLTSTCHSVAAVTNPST